MENQETPPEVGTEQKIKTVKAVPTTPIYAMFDLVEIEGKQVIAGSIGFKDQFGMERMAKTAGEKGVVDLGKHIVAIFAGQIDVAEPDDETKAKLAAMAAEEAKAQVVAQELKPEGVVDAEVIPFPEPAK